MFKKLPAQRWSVSGGKLKTIWILFLVLALLNFFYPRIAHADALTALSDTMSRLADSTPTAVYSDHTIKYTTPSG